MELEATPRSSESFPISFAAHREKASEPIADRRLRRYEFLSAVKAVSFEGDAAGAWMALDEAPATLGGGLSRLWRAKGARRKLRNRNGLGFVWRICGSMDIIRQKITKEGRRTGDHVWICGSLDIIRVPKDR